MVAFLVKQKERKTMNYAAYWDKLGIAGSGLCLIHCLALPVVVGILPGLGIAFLADEIVHQLLAFLLIAFAALAFIPGYRRHHDKRVLLLMATGLGLILFATWGGALVDLHGAGETVLSAAGSVLLISAHLLNHSFCRSCTLCKTNEAN
jgi:hypothetical protein